jgi:hypothetical protein
METSHPDILVTSPDGEYLMIVEVELNDADTLAQKAIEQLKRLMAAIGCSAGLLVSGDRVILLRDSFEESNGASVRVVGEAQLPDFLLPPADEQWRGNPGLEYESRVQRWLEKLKRPASLENLPDDLKALLSEPIISLLRLGEVRAAGPRWSKAVR